MSVVAVAVLLGIVVVALLRSRQVKLEVALACILFGLVLGATPAGPIVSGFLDYVGTWIWDVVQSW